MCQCWSFAAFILVSFSFPFLAFSALRGLFVFCFCRLRSLWLQLTNAFANDRVAVYSASAAAAAIAFAFAFAIAAAVAVAKPSLQVWCACVAHGAVKRLQNVTNEEDCRRCRRRRRRHCCCCCWQCEAANGEKRQIVRRVAEGKEEDENEKERDIAPSKLWD